MAIEIPWGKDDKLRLDLPRGWEVIAEGLPRLAPPLDDLNKSLEKALADPIQSAPLINILPAEGDICIVVDDISRPTPAYRIVPFLVEKILATGVEAGRLKIVFAVGLHRKMTEAEMAGRVTESIFKKIRCSNYSSKDKDKFIHLGRSKRGTDVEFLREVVESGLRILVGSIEPHPQAGFGGGMKNLLPGVASARTIGQNHLILPSPSSYNMIGTHPDDNPMRQDIEEAASMMPGKTFVINTILSPTGEVVEIAAGDPIAAHRHGITVTKRIYGISFPRKADVVISGSHPMDIDIRQGVKTVANVPGAVKYGGVILAFMRCEEGMKGVDIKLRPIPPMALVQKLMRLLGPRGIYYMVRRLPGAIPMDTRFVINFALQVLREAQILIYSPTLHEATGKRYPKLLFDDHKAMFDRARKILKKERAEVIVFPQGAVSIPILAGGS